jgi:hypothetical protein
MNFWKKLLSYLFLNWQQLRFRNHLESLIFKSYFQNRKSKIVLLGAFTALVAIASTATAPVLTASQVNVTGQTTHSNSQNIQRDKSSNLSSSEVDAIAAQTTVVIGQDLQKGDLEAQREFNPGSGVIFAKSGKTYYATTNLHVVRGRGGFYGVRTYDGEVYPVDDESTRSNIILLGEEQGENGETIRGFDLAVVQFTSDKEYPLANLPGNTSQGEQLFASGWPDPGNQSPRRVRRLEPGNLNRITSPSADGGYNLQYNCQTQRGMSGGPVFNAKGELVGIHGRAGEFTSVSNLGTQVAYLIGQTRTAQAPVLIPPENKKLNLGIQVTYLTQEAKKIQPLARVFPNLEFVPPPVQPSLISNGMPNRRPPSADVIDDIYKTFSRDFKHAAVRDCPSGGSGTILLGSKEERCEQE